MRPPLPTLGPQPKKSPVGPVMAISLLLGMGAGGVWWWKQRLASETQAPAMADAQAAAPVAQGPGDAGSTATAPTTAAAAPKATAPAAAAPTSADPLKAAGLSKASIRIDGPLETAVI